MCGTYFFLPGIRHWVETFSETKKHYDMINIRILAGSTRLIADPAVLLSKIHAGSILVEVHSSVCFCRRVDGDYPRHFLTYKPSTL